MIPATVSEQNVVPPPYAKHTLCCVFYGFPPQVLISYKDSSISELTISAEQKYTFWITLPQCGRVDPSMMHSPVSVFICIKGRTYF